MNYKSKYLKYKLKYLITKKLLGGSNSDRPKSAPTTPYEKERVAGPNTTDYDDPKDKKRGHHGDEKDIEQEREANDKKKTPMTPRAPLPDKLELDDNISDLDLDLDDGISDLDLDK